MFFNQKGKLIDNYEITGSISNLETKVIDAYKLEDINLNFKIKKDFFEFDIKDSKLFGIHFDTTKINMRPFRCKFTQMCLQIICTDHHR